MLSYVYLGAGVFYLYSSSSGIRDMLLMFILRISGFAIENFMKAEDDVP
jgi:hypothetical protein